MSEVGSTVNIAVDLDGTLIRTDLLHEAAVRFLLASPLNIFRMISWLTRGRAHLKTMLASRVVLDVSLLPYKAEVLDMLTRERQDGAVLVLATASPRVYADAVAEHLGIFDGVLATEDAQGNMKAEVKARAIAERFHGEPWAYVGDTAADLAVWSDSSRAIGIDLSPAVERQLTQLPVPATLLRTASPSSHILRAWAKQLRLHQWIKNLLVFVPILLAQRLTDPAALVASLVTFFAFSFMASAVYIWNDLSDLDSDRRHKSKRKRPLASGALPIPTAGAVAVVFGIGSIAMALAIGWHVAAALLGYLVLTNLYTLWLKRKAMIDIVMLAMLYTWRIIAGCVAIWVVPSIWLLSFSIFIFFSLALMKRYTELHGHSGKAHGRGYREEDLPLILSLGASSGILAVLVSALYIDSTAVRLQYHHPVILWLIIPPLLYWVSRSWVVAVRGQMHDDPVEFAVKDRVSLGTLLVVGVVAIAAALPW